MSIFDPCLVEWVDMEPADMRVKRSKTRTCAVWRAVWGVCVPASNKLDLLSCVYCIKWSAFLQLHPSFLKAFSLKTQNDLLFSSLCSPCLPPKERKNLADQEVLLVSTASAHNPQGMFAIKLQSYLWVGTGYPEKRAIKELVMLSYPASTPGSTWGGRSVHWSKRKVGGGTPPNL